MGPFSIHFEGDKTHVAMRWWDDASLAGRLSSHCGGVVTNPWETLYLCCTRTICRTLKAWLPQEPFLSPHFSIKWYPEYWLLNFCDFRAKTHLRSEMITLQTSSRKVLCSKVSINYCTWIFSTLTCRGVSWTAVLQVLLVCVWVIVGDCQVLL